MGITAQFTIVAIEPALLQHVGQDWVNPDRIELIPYFMTQQDTQGIVSALREEVERSKLEGSCSSIASDNTRFICCGTTAQYNQNYLVVQMDYRN